MKEKRFIDKEVMLEEIKTLSMHKLTLLDPHPQIKDRDMMLLPLEGYKEAMDLILYLLKTCIMALNADYLADNYIGEPELCTSEVLKLITQLMPYDEMDFLDEVNTMMKQLK